MQLSKLQEERLKLLQEKEAEMHINNNGPSVIYVETLQVQKRGQNVLVRLFSGMPAFTKEEIRFVGTVQFNKQLVKALCNQLDWIPSKEEVEAMGKARVGDLKEQSNSDLHAV